MATVELLDTDSVIIFHEDGTSDIIIPKAAENDELSSASPGMVGVMLVNVFLSNRELLDRANELLAEQLEKMREPQIDVPSLIIPAHAKD